MAIFQKIAIMCVRVYQLAISPLLGNNCRHLPTCSHYTVEAIETHGIFKGSWLAIKRIFRCHPFTEASLDPVPNKNCSK